MSIFPAGAARGPKGNTGDTGTKGDKGDTGDQGPIGLPGVNAVPADEAIGTYVSTPGTDTAAALDAKYASITRLPINVKDYGAVGDGVADDTLATTAAADAWAAALEAGIPSTLLFPPGTYRRTSTLTVSPVAASSGYVIGGEIVGHGAKLALEGSDPFGLVLSTYDTGKGWQRPRIEGLWVDGGGIRLRAGTNAEFIWNAVVDRVLVTNAPESALRLSGLFESQVINSCLEVDPAATVSADAHSCVYVEKETGKAQPSSIDLTNVTTRGGYYGIRSPHAADVKIQGGTVLAAQREGIYLQGAGLRVSGVHLENNWLSGVVTDAAAVRVEGSGRVENILSIAMTTSSMAPYTGTTSQTFAVRAFVYGLDSSGAQVAGTLSIERPGGYTNVAGAKLVRCTGGAAGSTLVLTNVPHADATLTAITSGRVERVGGNATTTGGRPSAVTSGAGAMHYDTTLLKPIWSDGSAWKDASGAAV